LTVIDVADILGPSPRVLLDSLNAHEPEKFGWADRLPERRLKDTIANKTGNEMLINRLRELKFLLLFIYLLLRITTNLIKIKEQLPLLQKKCQYFISGFICPANHRNKPIYYLP